MYSRTCLKRKSSFFLTWLWMISIWIQKQSPNKYYLENKVIIITNWHKLVSIWMDIQKKCKICKKLFLQIKNLQQYNEKSINVMYFSLLQGSNFGVTLLCIVFILF